MKLECKPIVGCPTNYITHFPPMFPVNVGLHDSVL